MTAPQSTEEVVVQPNTADGPPKQETEVQGGSADPDLTTWIGEGGSGPDD